MFLVFSFICVVFLCLFIIFFLIYCVWSLLFPGFKESWILFLKKVEFFLSFGFCPPKVGPVVCVSFLSGEICAEVLCVCSFFLWWARLSEVVILWWFGLYFCFVLLFFPLMGKTEWGGSPICLWLGLHFGFVCCLDEASCTECYWWLGDARSCIQVAFFV